MSRRKWLKPLLGAAAGVLLITLMLPSRDHRHTPQPEYTAKMVPQQEKQLKKECWLWTCPLRIPSHAWMQGRIFST